MSAVYSHPHGPQGRRTAARLEVLVDLAVCSELSWTQVIVVCGGVPSLWECSVGAIAVLIFLSCLLSLARPKAVSRIWVYSLVEALWEPDDLGKAATPLPGLAPSAALSWSERPREGWVGPL